MTLGSEGRHEADRSLLISEVALRCLHSSEQLQLTADVTSAFHTPVAAVSRT
jgi:hypothetical protein